MTGDPSKRRGAARIYLWIGSAVLCLNLCVVLFLVFGTRRSSCTIRVVTSQIVDGRFHFSYESSYTANTLSQEWESIDGDERLVGSGNGVVAHDRYVTKTLANMFGGRPRKSGRITDVPPGASEILVPKVGDVVTIKPGDSFVWAQFKDKDGRVVKWITRVVEATELPDPMR